MDLVPALTAAGVEINAVIGDALPIALPIGAGLLAITIGWKLFKRFVRG